MSEALWLILGWSGAILFVVLMILGIVLGLADTGRSIAKRSFDGPSLLMLILCSLVLGSFALIALL